MERESAETKATSRRAERLANLFMLSHEPMFVWSLDGPIELWNAGAERLYGFAPNEAVGSLSHSLLKTKFHCCPVKCRIDSIGRKKQGRIVADEFLKGAGKLDFFERMDRQNL